MDPPAEIPKKKLKLTEVDDVGIDKLLKDQDDDVLSIESSNLGEDRRILCQVIRFLVPKKVRDVKNLGPLCSRPRSKISR